MADSAKGDQNVTDIKSAKKPTDKESSNGKIAIPADDMATIHGRLVEFNRLQVAHSNLAVQLYRTRQRLDALHAAEQKVLAKMDEARQIDERETALLKARLGVQKEWIFQDGAFIRAPQVVSGN